MLLTIYKGSKQDLLQVIVQSRASDADEHSAVHEVWRTEAVRDASSYTTPVPSNLKLSWQ